MIAGASTTTQPPLPLRWTKSLYHQMAEMGWFRDKRVQLVEGEIIEMAPMGTPHWVVVNKANHGLLPLFPPDRFTISMQRPIDLGPDSEPEPDIAVIEGLPTDFENGSPTPDRIRLLIEVSDSSLAFDRSAKARLYAAAGIAEYWVIGIANRSAEIYRYPIANESRYATVTTHTGDDSLTPQSAATALRVSDFV